MNRLILLVLIAILAVRATFAQQATLNTPISRSSEDNYKVAELNIRSGAGGQSPQVLLTVSVQDSSGNEIRRFNMAIPDSTHSGATVAGFISALITVRATETGTDVRKANFRTLGYFSDQGYLSGVTLAP